MTCLPSVEISAGDPTLNGKMRILIVNTDRNISNLLKLTQTPTHAQTIVN